MIREKCRRNDVPNQERLIQHVAAVVSLFPSVWHPPCQHLSAVPPDFPQSFISGRTYVKCLPQLLPLLHSFPAACFCPSATPSRTSIKDQEQLQKWTGCLSRSHATLLPNLSSSNCFTISSQPHWYHYFRLSILHTFRACLLFASRFSLHNPLAQPVPHITSWPMSLDTTAAWSNLL